MNLLLKTTAVTHKFPVLVPLNRRVYSKIKSLSCKNSFGSLLNYEKEIVVDNHKRSILFTVLHSDAIADNKKL